MHGPILPWVMPQWKYSDTYILNTLRVATYEGWAPSSLGPKSMAKPTLNNSFLILFFIFTISPSLFYVESSHYEAEELSWLDEKDDEVIMVQSKHDSLRSCDFTSGKWFYDQSYPLYDSSCPYLTTAVTCQKNGRPDSDYEKWRWKPQGCSIPRYFW